MRNEHLGKIILEMGYLVSHNSRMPLTNEKIEVDNKMSSDNFLRVTSAVYRTCMTRARLYASLSPGSAFIRIHVCACGVERQEDFAMLSNAGSLLLDSL